MSRTSRSLFGTTTSKLNIGTTSIFKSKKDNGATYHSEKNVNPLSKSATGSTPTRPTTITQSVQNTAPKSEVVRYYDPKAVVRYQMERALGNNPEKPQLQEVPLKDLPSVKYDSFATENTSVETPVERQKVTQKHFNAVTKEWETEITYKEVESPESSAESDKDSNSNIETAQGETEDKVNDTKEKYATANLVYIATPMTIQIKPGDTVTLLGLGKYLSGDWLVQDVTRNISSNGYTHQATVYKPDMMTSLKASSTTSKESESKTAVSSTDTVNEQGGQILAYTVVAGDNYYSLTKKFKDESHMEYNNLVDQNSGEAINEKTELKVGQVILIK